MALGDVMASRFSHSWASASTLLDEFSGPVADGGDNISFDPGRVQEHSEEAESGEASTSTVYLPQTMVLCDFRHECFEDCVPKGPSESGLVSKWRPKDRLKTGCVALVLCLNIGVDPPDVIKISPCARLECWIDPFSMVASKALDQIGKALQAQYDRWQPRARYKTHLDPTVEDVKKLCTSCRKYARSERVLFHYNGHGVPKPTANGEIWVFNKSYTQYIPLPVSDLDSWLRTPSIYVFDCSAAGMIVNAFLERQDVSSSESSVSKDCILLASCGANETLPQSSEFPADVFTSCLTTPIKMALHWFCTRSLLRDALDRSLIDKIPGRQTDRKTLLGELNWIFTAVTDTIAWNVLPRDLFQRLFRQDLLVASLFRNFLLAERIMKAANCSPISYPVLPSTHLHHMWDAWDMAAEICLSKLPQMLEDPNAEIMPSPFFTEQLTAFEVWLDHGYEHKKPPEQLPIVLQVLLSQSHRYRALVLLGRFLDLGPWAVDLALSVGIFPYVLKLLQTTAMELRQFLVFIWTKILALDKSCQADLVKEEGHAYFIKYLDSSDAYPEQRAMASFVLAVIVDGHHQGQEACVRANLIHICFKHLQTVHPHNVAHPEPLLLQWLCLCLGKLWEDFPEAQLIGLQADAASIFASLLSEPQPEVRAAATFALGTLLDIGADMFRDRLVSSEDFDDDEKVKVDLSIVKSLLQVVGDGSPLVRSEIAVALARFAFGHAKQLKLVAATYLKSSSNSVLNSLPSLSNINGPSSAYPNASIHLGSGISSQVGPLVRIGGDSIGCVRDSRVSTSSPIASSGIMHGSPPSDCSSQHSDCGIMLKDNSSNGGDSYTKSKQFDNSVYLQCVLSMSILAKDPSPKIARLGRRALSIIGIEQVVTKASRINCDSDRQRDVSTPVGLARSSSWFEMNSGHLSTTFRTPPVSPPRQNYLTGLRRVCSLEFRPHQLGSPDVGLADPLLSSGGASGVNERILLPESTIFNWSCGYFTKSLLISADDNEDIMARREDRERIALDRIAKCQHSSVGKFSNPIASWDTKFESGTKAVVLLPFSPVVVAADENERIRVWNYEEATSLNSFFNHDVADRGISKLCLVNELHDNLLLVASRDGNVRVWKDFSLKGKQKLVTTFSSMQFHKTGVCNTSTVVDWQQQSGYFYSAADMSSVMLWDLDKEQLISSIPTRSECSISALSASQVHGGQFVAGFVDASVRLFDIRTPEMLICTTKPHRHAERVIGVSFQPSLDPSKIVSASQAGDIQFLDMRHDLESFLTIESHRGSLTALAVHCHAPVIASGSAKQIVKVFSLEGLPLGTIRYYHPTFMAQRIGSVSCLAFHPYKVLLAAGASDPCLSIYPDDNFLAK